MTSGSAEPESSGTSSSSQGDFRTKAEDAMSKIGDVAKHAANETRQSAAMLASEASEGMKALIGEQVGTGARLIGHVAASARVAADDLARNAPQLAGLVRDAGLRMEQFSQEIRGQSVDQLVRRTSDFARDRPAMVFGAAAACGFFLFRLFRAGSATSRGPIARNHQGGQASGGGHPSVSPLIASPYQGQSHGA